MNRSDALVMMEEWVQTPNLKKHLLASEVFMKELARKFEPEKEESWGIVGLLHDADQDVTGKSMEKHTVEIAKKLAEMKIDQDIIDAIQGHADKVERKTMMAKSMYACDELTGLIVACALVKPEKKLEVVSAENVLKKFKEKSFAAGANREQILTCESELQIPLPEFVGLGLKAMKTISGELSL